MNKKIGAIILIVIGVVLITFFLTQYNDQNEPTRIVTIGDDRLTLIEALTAEEQIKGLSNRISLEEYEGMLFLFEPERKDITFWMNDMLIDIDIVWVSDDVIVQIDRSVVHPEGDEKPEVRSSPVGVFISSVIEVEATESRSWKVGDPVSLGY